MVVKMDAKLNLGPMKIKYNKAFEPGGVIQHLIDSTILNGVKPYVPRRIGILAKSGVDHTKIGSGLLTWSTPYVRVMWYGKSKTGKDLKYDQSRSPLAGKMWVIRYVADHRTELREMVARKAESL